MAHIALGVNETDYPGISGPLIYRAETARPLSELAEVLLRGPSTLSRGERELIAAYVSGRNECTFCCGSHSAIAAVQLEEDVEFVEQVRGDLDHAPVSPKLRALLRIAGAVQVSGRDVTPELINAARKAGASDLELHDAVLIAAAFCMYNRYVDGLGTMAPDDPDLYAHAAKRISEYGYLV
ncbi:carboxymuconolactone decarboxylase family protein [Jatrophihabitans sp.]|uniref:carboxymuconolactone decarboxylase family protein n=1 Tax=Jatrophihabitans sp. TaxID=1932789 RepID=UPI002C2ACB0A|nr:carboxymuconolactone decarboxylase family protein [Jatrophihabitans sp.]